jgi:transposase
MQYPLEIRLYLVMDNFSAHTTDEIDEWLEKNNAERVLTATNASWMNRIECHFSPLKKFAIENSNPKNHSELIAYKKINRTFI